MIWINEVVVSLAKMKLTTMLLEGKPNSRFFDEEGMTVVCGKILTFFIAHRYEVSRSPITEWHGSPLLSHDR
jgi:hypothetical protein